MELSPPEWRTVLALLIGAMLGLGLAFRFGGMHRHSGGAAGYLADWGTIALPLAVALLLVDILSGVAGLLIAAAVLLLAVLNPWATSARQRIRRAARGR